MRNCNLLARLKGDIRQYWGLQSIKNHTDRGCTFILGQKRDFASESSTGVVPEITGVPLSVPTFQVWGANTGVGKTLVSAGLLRAAKEDGKVFYLKPVQTGFPNDSDARMLAAVLHVESTNGQHAAELAQQQPSNPTFGLAAVHTLCAWRQPVSPHLAVAGEGRDVADEQVRDSTLEQLNAFAQAASTSGRDCLALVETAGGPASPGPSGRLQCDLYRPLRLPALLVGDGRLGGISTTISAYETLSNRGYDVAAIAIMDPGGLGNSAALTAYLSRASANAPPVVSLPMCASPSGRGAAESGEIDSELKQWLEASTSRFQGLLDVLRHHHSSRVKRLEALALSATKCVWYPFTQHDGLSAADITTIDARSGEHFLVFKQDQGRSLATVAADPGSSQEVHDFNDRSRSGPHIEPYYDACASWWTQGLNAELHGLLVSKMTQAAARYGHVMHPMAAIEPTVQLAEKLLATVGQGWADRVFYSDDGSTAVEVALKMAFRKFWADHPEVDLVGKEGSQPAQLAVIGIEGGYHGDTLGAMDAVAPSPYNGPKQFPWYTGRGLFLAAPYVALVRGKWRRREAQGSFSATAESWESLDELLSAARKGTPLAKSYTQQINAEIDRYEQEAQTRGVCWRAAALILEPLLQGAGGMTMVDPLYQRCLVQAARARHIPVIFDEVFTGLWRLGSPSAASLLGVQPDIACYAKLLTGGLLPLSATLASKAVFNAFRGNSKLQALLHGHSYSGHSVGAGTALAALKIFSDPLLNPALLPEGQRLRQLWPQHLVRQLSHVQGVDSVVALGTVLAAELCTGDGGGYASGESARVVQQLLTRGVFARSLGNVLYLMVTPTTSQALAGRLLLILLDVLKERETPVLI